MEKASWTGLFENKYQKAVSSGREKSLGPHRFVLALFQKACGIVKDDLMTVFRTSMILE